jgi:uncharacterized membrane protein YozB (DUF420 family)
LYLQAVTVLGKFNLAGKINFPFDVHLFAFAHNAIINGTVATSLIAGLLAVKKINGTKAIKIMMAAMLLSILFYSPISVTTCLAGQTMYGDTGRYCWII